MEFSLSELNDVLGDIRNLREGKRDFLNFKNISIDSRTLLKNDLFIAIKGKNFDGHSFLPEVLNKGVKSVVIKKGMQGLLPSNFPYWVVNDTTEAFQKLALLKRKKLNIPISKKPNTFFLDEIDNGLSGKSLFALVDLIKEISKDQQVLCITHQPFLAAGGLAHFKVNKNVIDGITYTSILKLTTKKQRKHELIELIGGASSGVDEYASKLIDQAAA